MQLLTDYDTRSIRVPVYSQASAGKPLADCVFLGWRTIRIPRGYRKEHSYCAVLISGDSLIDEGILDGDYAICRLTSELERNGQLAAVLLADGLVLKHVWFEGRRVRLQSRNRKYNDRVLSVEEVTIQGLVVRIERDL
jgi:repressor LexA